ncbi:DUF6694 family lipoprotein [Roseibium sp. MMSF_3544]|uniref:DUF6694 family lipoprotein n=1 Tax=unclassified Roseibium TaxID=2629323 RepID=UPI0035325125
MLKAVLTAGAILVGATTVMSFSVRAQTIDASSAEAMEKSIAVVVSKLSPEDQQRFKAALTKITVTALLPKAFARPKAENGASKLSQADVIAFIRPMVDGKTAAEIIAAGLKTPNAGKATPEPKSQVADKEGKKRCLMSALPVKNARVERMKYVSSRQLRVTVTNNLSWPVSSVRISYSVQSQNRQVPWEEGNSFYKISGGINPGESREIGIGLYTTPNDIPANELSITASVADVVDADNRQFVREVTLIGAHEETSSRTCLD